MASISLTDILPLIGVVIGAAIGAILTCLVERAVQTRSWKREFANKKINTVYVPLYREVLTLPAALRGNWIYPTPSSAIHSTAWDEVKNTEAKLLIQKPLLDQLEKLYTVDLPTAQNSFDKAYRAIRKAIIEYFNSVANESKTQTNQAFLDSMAFEAFNYYSILLMENWEAFKRQFVDDEHYASYMNGAQAMFASHLRQAAGPGSTIQLPSNFLHQIKFRIDNLEEVKIAKENRANLIQESEVIVKALEQYITQYWAKGEFE